MLEADLDELLLELRPDSELDVTKLELERFGMIVMDKGEHRERLTLATAEMRFEGRIEAYTLTPPPPWRDPVIQLGPFEVIEAVKLASPAAVAYLDADGYERWRERRERGELSSGRTVKDAVNDVGEYLDKVLFGRAEAKPEVLFLMLEEVLDRSAGRHDRPSVYEKYLAAIRDIYREAHTLQADDAYYQRRARAARTPLR